MYCEYIYGMWGWARIWSIGVVPWVDKGLFWVEFGARLLVLWCVWGKWCSDCVF